MISTTLVTVAAIGVVLLFAWWCGRLVRVFGQPPVVGELAAGILTGPSVFGALAPELSAQIFTPTAISALGYIAQAAVLVFMFLVGLELDTAVLRRHARGVVRIAAFSLLVPFVLGCGLAAWLYPSMHGPVMHRPAFILFFGTVMSITAMPVLARILADWRMLATTIGTITAGCAAIDDIAAWTMLGLVAEMLGGRTNALPTLAMSVVYLIVMLRVVRPALERLLHLRNQRLGRVAWVVAVILVAAASAAATEWLGIHAVFGAFIAGACIPRAHGVLEGIEVPLRRVSSVLLPAFFVLVGLRTEASLMADAGTWAITAVIVLCASLGKVGGAATAARTLGFTWRDSVAIGALLNTRGLVALVALEIGRKLGLLSPSLFTILVVTILITTLATVPLLRALGFRPLPASQ